MEKTVNLNLPGAMELGIEELKEVGGGGILAKTLGTIVGALMEEISIAGNYYYQDGNYMYSPLR